MFEPFTLPYVQRGLLEILLLSVGAGVIGTWNVLRGLAFLVHAVSTATFPGLVQTLARATCREGTRSSSSIPSAESAQGCAASSSITA